MIALRPLTRCSGLRSLWSLRSAAILVPHFCQAAHQSSISSSPVSRIKTAPSLRSMAMDASKAGEGPTEEGKPFKADSAEDSPLASSMRWSTRSMKIAAALMVAWAFSLCGVVVIEWGRPSYTATGELIEDEFSKKYPAWIARIARAIDVAMDSYQKIRDPTSDKLLPDPVKYPLYQPKYTLVVEHSGVLVHPEWSYKTGWRYKKRPGLDYFFTKVGYPVFELVLFTKEPALTTMPILSGLGADNKVFAALYREDTRYRRGVHIKDLSCLNRDLSKIIIIDWDEKAFQLQPRNGLHRVKKWNGESDRTLYELADFLEMIATSNVNDVREVLDHYNQEPDPLAAFVERQQKLIKMSLDESAISQSKPSVSKLAKRI